MTTQVDFLINQYKLIAGVPGYAFPFLFDIDPLNFDDPIAGTLCLNDADPEAATKLLLTYENKDEVDVSAWEKINTTGVIFINKFNDPDCYAMFQVANMTDKTTWIEWDITFIAAFNWDSLTDQSIVYITLNKNTAGHTIQDDGTSKTQRTKLNIIGATIEDDPTNDATKVTIPDITGKQDKEAGKGLSTNDYDDAAVIEVAKIAGKQDQEAGKGLSQENYTTTEKNKLASITEIFTTALKAAYDNVVNNFSSLAVSFAAHLLDYDNPHEVTKAQVGLSDIENIAYLPMEAASGSGTEVTFTADKFYGTTDTPETGNITATLTGAKLGVTVCVIHQTGSEPTYPVTFIKVGGSYDSAKLNYIYIQYIDDTHQLYSIVNNV